MNTVDTHKLINQLRHEAVACVKNAPFVHEPVSRLLNIIERDQNWISELIEDGYDSVSKRAQNSCPTSTIPKFYHKIWLTDPENPSLPPSEYLEKLVLYSKCIPSDWTIFVWVNSPEIASYCLELISKGGLGLIVADIRVVFKGDQLMHVINRFIYERKFVLAGDVLKVAVLNRFGGVYSDLGLQLSAEILSIATHVDYIFLMGHAVFLQTSMLAAPANSQLLAIFANVMTRPESFPRSVVVTGSSVTSTDEVRIFSGVGATICMLLFANPEHTLLILPTRSDHFEWEAKGSWYRNEGTSGNVMINESSPTFISDDLYAISDGSLDSGIHGSPLDRLRTNIIRLSIGENDKAISIPGECQHLPRSVRTILSTLSRMSSK